MLLATNWRCIILNAVFVIIIATIKSCFSLRSPCPEIFQYNFDGSDWFGIIDLKVSSPGHPFKLIVDVTLNGTTPVNFIGSLDLKVNRKEKTEFKIKFPLFHFISKLRRILLNDIEICADPGTDGYPSVTILALDQTASGQITFDTSIRNITQQGTEPPILMNNSAITNRKYQQSNCGELAERFMNYSVYNTVGDFERGSWPWLAAIYIESKTQKKLIYNCVGSLITSNAVLTAAICIRFTTSNITVYLGLHNLDEPEQDGVFKSKVFRKYIHPSFQPPSANADIAIIQLSEKVEFSEFIHPACLWTESKELKDVVGKNGYYAGWGVDLFGLLSKVPYKGKSKIVSQEDCLQSYSVFESITSSGTFCAGMRNGEGPCSGYAGAGLFIRTDSKWILRGIVAKAILTIDGRCDLYKYVVYADVTQYLEWIENILGNFL